MHTYTEIEWLLSITFYIPPYMNEPERAQFNMGCGGRGSIKHFKRGFKVIYWILLSTWDLGLEEIRAISDFAL